MKKFIAALTGLALLVLPHQSYAQEECTDQNSIRLKASEAGVIERTSLVKPGLTTFLRIFLETTQGSVTDEEMEAVSSINRISIFDKDDVSYLVIFVNDCVVRVVPLQKALIDFVMKQVEQRAGEDSNT